MNMTNAELIQVIGGVNLSGTLLNYLVKGIGTIVDIGRSFGTSIRRLWEGNICSL